jgi:hypothetical protein
VHAPGAERVAMAVRARPELFVGVPRPTGGGTLDRVALETLSARLARWAGIDDPVAQAELPELVARAVAAGTMTRDEAQRMLAALGLR